MELDLRPTVQEELTKIAGIHRWQVEAVIEWLLFLIPHGSRLGESAIEAHLKSVNISANGMEAALKRLERRGVVGKEPAPGRRHEDEDQYCYFLVRSRYVQLQSAMSGETVAVDAVKSPEVDVRVLEGKQHSRWRQTPDWLAKHLAEVVVGVIVALITAVILAWLGLNQ